MQEQLSKCEERCALLEVDVLQLNNRIQKIEHSHGRMQEAFIKNDLGLPDYDGHRSDHKFRKEEAQVVEGYKRDATKRLIDIIMGGAAAIFVLGFIEWIRSHIK